MKTCRRCGIEITRRTGKHGESSARFNERTYCSHACSIADRKRTSAPTPARSPTERRTLPSNLVKALTRTPISDDEDLTWQQDANCLGVDPDLFFPERGGPTRQAKEICRGCSVRETCLAYAITHAEKFGIWGGLSERERRRIRRERSLAATNLSKRVAS